jgi:isoprenylcysteine carboxyl methyltransferase (ICMT) family protein YpbQ
LRIKELRDKSVEWNIVAIQALIDQNFIETLRECHAMSQHEYNIWSAGAKDFGRTHAHDPSHLQAYYSLFA